MMFHVSLWPWLRSKDKSHYISGRFQYSAPLEAVGDAQCIVLPRVAVKEKPTVIVVGDFHCYATFEGSLPCVFAALGFTDGNEPQFLGVFCNMPTEGGGVHECVRSIGFNQ